MRGTPQSVANFMPAPGGDNVNGAIISAGTDGACSTAGIGIVSSVVPDLGAADMLGSAAPRQGGEAHVTFGTKSLLLAHHMKASPILRTGSSCPLLPGRSKRTEPGK